MKAIVCRRYGPPDVLALEDAAEPSVRDGDVLVRVCAASINSWDWDNLTGRPAWVRLISGLRRPARLIPGADIAGIVEAVGRKVTKFEPGDAVFGDLSGYGWGAFAQRVCAREQDLAHKPSGATFEQAAAVPQAAVMALQAIHDYADTQPGHKVLINGAGGGVGSFAVQLAKARGAQVTGVDRAGKLDFVRSLGADHVVDFAREDFAQGSQRYDVILDMVAQRSMGDCARALEPGGIYIVVGGSILRILQLLALRRWFASRGKRLVVLVHQPNKQLTELGELLQSGKLVPAIDGPYALADVPQAFRRFGEGLVRGKAVITIGGAH